MPDVRGHLVRITPTQARPGARPGTAPAVSHGRPIRPLLTLMEGA